MKRLKGCIFYVKVSSLLGISYKLTRENWQSQNADSPIDLNKIEIKEIIETENDEFLDILWSSLDFYPDQTGRKYDMVFRPDVKRYYEGWGKNDDCGFFAFYDKKPIGACWARMIDQKDLMYDDYPDLGLGLLFKFQGIGIGSLLLNHLLDYCKAKYNGIRLVVNNRNQRAISFYLKHGFQMYDNDEIVSKMRIDF
jgi:GNAT superfamily N-acetyltransferase